MTDLDAALRAQDWRKLTAQITAYAHRRLGRRATREAAEDVAQKAMTQLFDPEYKAWDPAKEPNLFVHLTSLVNSIVYAERTRARTKRERAVPDDELLEASGVYGAAPSPERDLASAELIERAWAMMRERAQRENDALLLQLIDQFLKGNDEAAAQARAIDVDIVDIRNARRRFFSLRDRVARELGIHEEDGDDA